MNNNVLNMNSWKVKVDIIFYKLYSKCVSKWSKNEVARRCTLLVQHADRWSIGALTGRRTFLRDNLRHVRGKQRGSRSAHARASLGSVLSEVVYQWHEFRRRERVERAHLNRLISDRRECTSSFRIKFLSLWQSWNVEHRDLVGVRETKDEKHWKCGNVIPVKNWWNDRYIWMVYLRSIHRIGWSEVSTEYS